MLPPVALPGDEQKWRCFKERYDYDASGNLIERLHETGGETQAFSMRVDTASNRATFADEAIDPGDVFDAMGRPNQLHRNESLRWSLVGHLIAMPFIDERYAYDANDRIVRKIKGAVDERLLPGVRLREGRDLATVSCCFGVCRISTHDQPSGTWRYDAGDRQRNVVLTTDERGKIVAFYGYRPYGQVAWLAAVAAHEVAGDTFLYAGEECGRSGLYDFGLRYYMPAAARWLSPDPAGNIDGLNRFAYVLGNPVTLVDRLGAMWSMPEDDVEIQISERSSDSLIMRTVQALSSFEQGGSRIAVVLGALGLAADIADTAVAALRASGDRSGNILERVIAQAYDLSVDDVDYGRQIHRLRMNYAEDLDEIASDLRRRMRTGEYGIRWNTDSPHVAAQVIMEDPLHRVFFNARAESGASVLSSAHTWIHEVSHFSGTLDIIYLSGVEEDAEQLDFYRRRDVERHFSRQALRAGQYDPPAVGAESGRRANPSEQAVIDRMFRPYEGLNMQRRRAAMVDANADHRALIAVMAGSAAVVNWSIALRSIRNDVHPLRVPVQPRRRRSL